MKRIILCIDLKSFYASCECLLLKKDPFKTPLVVASKSQGSGAITLAVTPYLKQLGVQSRRRLFEIPKEIKYIHIHPKMGYYVEKSKEVISVYLDYISKEDLHVYSVDEAFLDVTTYLDYYNMDPISLGKKIMEDILNKTGLYSACGIGENMFIAKTAMDIDAKKSANNIAYWKNDVAKRKLMEIENLTGMWGIGTNMEKKLNKLGIFSVKNLALYNKNKLISELGIIGEELWNHANAIDEAIICENSYTPKNISYGNSQILFKNYNSKNIKLIIRETIELLTKRLRKNNKSARTITLSIGYSLEIKKSFHHSVTLDNYTKDENELYGYAIFLLDKYVEDYPIRKISITLSSLKNVDFFQPNLFDSNKNIKLNNELKFIDKIQDKYGKNSLVKASALLDDSTLLDRNKKLGGHSL